MKKRLSAIFLSLVLGACAMPLMSSAEADGRNFTPELPEQTNEDGASAAASLLEDCHHADADKDGVCDNCSVGLYVNRYYDTTEKTVVDELLPIPADAVAYSDETTLEAGKWYVVSGSVEVSGRITVSGTSDAPTNIILKNGAELNVAKGIGVKSSNELHIYGQSGDSGRLVATGASNSAGIGGGGTGTATAAYKAGTIVVFGGTVEATGGSNAAGIGGGFVRLLSGTVLKNFTMYGGNVTAVDGGGAAGIGTGERGDCGDITIYGGTLTATGYFGGIGSGFSACGTVAVYGGDVTARVSGEEVYSMGNGIGGLTGFDGFIMTGGTVTAIGVDYPGIGSDNGETGSTFDVSSYVIMKAGFGAPGEDTTPEAYAVSRDNYVYIHNHHYENGVCKCGDVDLSEMSETLPFSLIFRDPSDLSYSFECEHFTVTAARADAGGIYGGDADNILTVTSGDPDIKISRIEAVVGDFGENYGNVGVSAGTKSETGSVTDGDTVTVTDIDAVSFSFGDGTAAAAFKEITVYYRTFTHEYTSTARDNGNGTHSFKCRLCDEYGAPALHVDEDGDCKCDICGGVDLVSQNKADIAALVSMSAEYTAAAAQSARYTAESLAALKAIYDTFGDMRSDLENFLVTHADFVTFTESWQDALDGLVIRDADYSTVDAAIAAYELLNEEDYSAASWAVLVAAVNAVDRTLNIDHQSEVYPMAWAINDAIDALKAHIFTDDYRDNGDGTHSVKCDECGIYAHTEDHTFVGHVCVCGAADTCPTVLELSAIRFTETPGLRFVAYVTAEQREMCTEYGFLVARENAELKNNPAHLVFNSSRSVSAANAYGVTYTSGAAFDVNNDIDRLYAEEGSEFGLTGTEAYFYTGVMTGIPAAYYAEHLVARPYMVVDGVTLYGKCFARSMYENAFIIRAGGYADLTDDEIKYVDGILKSVEDELELDLDDLL